MTTIVALLCSLLTKEQVAAAVCCPLMWVIPLGALMVDVILILGY